MTQTKGLGLRTSKLIGALLGMALLIGACSGDDGADNRIEMTQLEFEAYLDTIDIRLLYYLVDIGAVDGEPPCTLDEALADESCAEQAFAATSIDVPGSGGSTGEEMSELTIGGWIAQGRATIINSLLEFEVGS